MKMELLSEPVTFGELVEYVFIALVVTGIYNEIRNRRNKR